MAPVTSANDKTSLDTFLPVSASCPCRAPSISQDASVPSSSPELLSPSQPDATEHGKGVDEFGLSINFCHMAKTLTSLFSFSLSHSPLFTFYWMGRAGNLRSLPCSRGPNCSADGEGGGDGGRLAESSTMKGEIEDRGEMQVC